MRKLTNRDRVRNEAILQKMNTQTEVVHIVDRNILNWVGYIKRIDATYLTKIMRAGVDGRALRGKPA